MVMSVSVDIVTWMGNQLACVIGNVEVLMLLIFDMSLCDLLTCWIFGE